MRYLEGLAHLMTILAALATIGMASPPPPLTVTVPIIVISHPR